MSRSQRPSGSCRQAATRGRRKRCWCPRDAARRRRANRGRCAARRGEARGARALRSRSRIRGSARRRAGRGGRTCSGDRARVRRLSPRPASRWLRRGAAAAAGRAAAARRGAAAARRASAAVPRTRGAGGRAPWVERALPAWAARVHPPRDRSDPQVRSEGDPRDGVSSSKSQHFCRHLNPRPIETVQK